MPLPQQDEFGTKYVCEIIILLYVSMPLPQQDEFGVKLQTLISTINNQ